MFDFVPENVLKNIFIHLAMKKKKKKPTTFTPTSNQTHEIIENSNSNPMINPNLRDHKINSNQTQETTKLILKKI